ncbi:MAG: FAD binding domain-containing protein [Tissierellales bacterium]|nr:FAD binding domain-containing protein [Tissierellales bacterium]MBN2827266.1 FAD binding domain-containing protein [Tissierellales bacterium]
MFESFRPNSLKDLLTLIDGRECYKFAGGTDLYIRKRQWQGAERKFDKDVAFIGHLDELRGIERDGYAFHIKACTTQNDVVNSSILPEYIRVPYRLMGNPAIRNTATVGGNIANAAQVADSLPILYATDALLLLKSILGSRIVRIQDFIVGKYRTNLAKNEIIEEVIVPDGNFNGYAYRKIGSRKASILSKLSIFIVYRKENQILEDVRVCIGAVNEIPIRSPEAEKIFLKNHDIEAFLLHLKKMFDAETDKRSTKFYREEVSIRLVRHFLEKILEDGE